MVSAVLKALDDLEELAGRLVELARSVKKHSGQSWPSQDRAQTTAVEAMRAVLTQATTTLQECTAVVERAVNDATLADTSSVSDESSRRGDSSGDEEHVASQQGSPIRQPGAQDELRPLDRTRAIHLDEVRQEHDEEFPSNVRLDRTDHLLLVVHGIGEHEDFKQGNAAASAGEFPTFKTLFHSLQASHFGDVPLNIDIQSIEWHDALHHSTGLDKVFDLIAPPGATRIRDFNKRAFMDIFYYSAPAYGQMIVDAVTAQLNAKFHAHRAKVPTSAVSIFAHSLGTMICYDILTHAKGETRLGITFPGLDFPVEHFFAAGSPVPVMLLGRGDVCLEHGGRFTPGRIRRPPCAYYNLLHPADPIAYRVEPLLYSMPSEDWSQPAPLLPDSIQRRRYLSSSDLLADWATHLMESADKPLDHHRHDFALRRTHRQEGILELATAPASHSVYWMSEDVALFTLLQVCHPVVTIIKQYIAAGRPPPTFSEPAPTLTPTTAIQWASFVNSKPRLAWHARVLLADHEFVYVVRKPKRVRCNQRWRIPLLSDAGPVQVSADECAEGTRFIVTQFPPFNTIALQAPSTAERDEWIAAINGTARTCGESAESQMSCKMESGLEYFGAVKVGDAFHESSRAWLALTPRALICFDAAPIALDTQYVLRTTDIAARTKSPMVLNLSTSRLSLDVQFKQPATLTLWRDTVLGRFVTNQLEYNSTD